MLGCNTKEKKLLLHTQHTKATYVYYSIPFATFNVRNTRGGDGDVGGQKPFVHASPVSIYGTGAKMI